MQTHSTESPPPIQTPRFVQPGVLRLDAVRWGQGEAFVIGAVGGAEFAITVATADLLNRRRFGFALWRYRSLLAIQPDLTDWQLMIAQAEGGAA